MKKALNCLLLLTCFSVICKAQQIISSGGLAVRPGLSVDWVLGGSLSVASDYYIYTSLEDTKDLASESGYSIKVYPTLTCHLINIEISPLCPDKFILELYNSMGVRINIKKFENQSRMQLNLSKLSTGVYFLKVFLPGQTQPLAIEKIVKF